MNKIRNKSINIGNENDEELRSALLNALHQLEAKKLNHEWGLGGSQELETLIVLIEGKEIVIESETYIGLTISGDEKTIEKIQESIQKSMGD